MNQICCTVTTCKHWQKSNHCTANQVLVQSNQPPANPGLQPGDLVPTPVSAMEATCCHSFQRH